MVVVESNTGTMISHLVFKVLSYLISLIIAMVRHLSTLHLYFSSYTVHYSWYPANCQGFPSKIPVCMMKCWECSHHHQDQQGPADGGVEQFGNIIVEELAEGECTDYMPSKCPLTWQWIGLPENAPDFNPLTHIWWSSHLVCQVHAKGLINFPTDLLKHIGEKLFSKSGLCLALKLPL